MAVNREIIRFALSPTSYLIEKAIETTVKTFANEADSPSASTSELEELALRQEIEARVLKEQARIEQELAIARRIDNAEEVEIEEYYDTSGEGALGLKGDGNGVTVGASGSGKKVVKRVYKFRGYRAVVQNTDTSVEVVEDEGRESSS
ncbi:MAG: hypothetical protein HC800_22810 [Phormidesmis sp. RL_2_1]|nr:hypothetical protein [Phormidesmis sp. RL_2_1]